MGSVMDGCSGGISSYFAATLFGKILNKVYSTMAYPQVAGFATDSASTNQILEYCCKMFFDELIQTKNQLFLERNELLSTLIIAVYNSETLTLSVACAGDGAYAVNGLVTLIEQQNKPNYLAYHLEKGFKTWYTQETLVHHMQGVSSFAIATDGVESFASESLTEDDTNFDAVSYLLTDVSLSNNPAMLHKKCLIMEGEYRLIPRDDVAIIRVING